MGEWVKKVKTDSAEYDDGVAEAAKLRWCNADGELSDKVHHRNVTGVCQNGDWRTRLLTKIVQ